MSTVVFYGHHASQSRLLKHFKVVGVVAYCLVAECQQPNISLGALPKPGEKKRLGLGFSTFVCADLARGAVVSKLAKDDPLSLLRILELKSVSL